MNTKATIEDVQAALALNGKVMIRGFGTFTLVDKPARTMTSPITGDPIEIPARRVVRFKPSPMTAKAL